PLTRPLWACAEIDAVVQLIGILNAKGPIPWRDIRVATRGDGSMLMQACENCQTWLTEVERRGSDHTYRLHDDLLNAVAPATVQAQQGPDLKDTNEFPALGAKRRG